MSQFGSVPDSELSDAWPDSELSDSVILGKNEVFWL